MPNSSFKKISTSAGCIFSKNLSEILVRADVFTYGNPSSSAHYEDTVSLGSIGLNLMDEPHKTNWNNSFAGWHLYPVIVFPVKSETVRVYWVKK